MYVFENGNVVKDTELLEKDLDKVVYVDELPPIEGKAGYIAVLKASVKEQRVWWEYKPFPEIPFTVEDVC